MKARRAAFTSPSGEPVTAEYDLLVGADGVNSRVRCPHPLLQSCWRAAEAAPGLTWNIQSMREVEPVRARTSRSGDAAEPLHLDASADADLLSGGRPCPARGTEALALLCGGREELGRQVAGLRQRWFGRMHRVDKFFHRVRPPPSAHMDTHRGAWFVAMGA